MPSSFRRSFGIALVEASDRPVGGFGGLDLGIHGYLGADAPERRLLHVDGKTGLPF